MLQVLQAQAQQLAQERDALLEEKRSLQIEVEEYRAAAVKMSEPEHHYREELAEQESYIEGCEEQIEELTEELARRLAAGKQLKAEIADLKDHIENQGDQLQRLAEENAELRQDLAAYKRRRLSEQTGYQGEQPQDGKKLKVPTPLAEKENQDVAGRRSSCIWGLAAKAQQESKRRAEESKRRAEAAKSGKYFNSTDAVIGLCIEDKENK